MVAMQGDKILDRIQKMLALSEGTHSQEEAQTAMLKVQEMLLTHGLTMGDVEGFQEQTKKKEKKVDHVGVGIRKPRMTWYWRSIGTIVADNLKCYLYINNVYDYDRHERVPEMKLIGLEQDVQVAIATIKFAISTAESCYKAWKKESDKVYRALYGKAQSSRIKNDYMIGFASGLKQKFAEQVTERALVLVKDALVDAEYAKLNIRTDSHSIRIGGSNEAKIQGYHDGLNAKKDAYIQ